jgi:predicted MFS family arabinose efflux permease
LLINSALRMTYPFLPALARGLGVSLGAVAQLVALRALAGFLSPLFSPLSERFGRRLVLVLSMLLFTLGCFIVVIWPAYWPLGATLVVTGTVKVIYDPVMQSYLGDSVPYRQRGKAIAVTEFAWAGSLLVGAPLIGLIIERQGWQAPFFWLGAAGIVGLFLLWRFLPPGLVQATRAANLSAMVTVVRQHPEIWAVASYILLAMVANEVLFIVYGDWMEQSFGLALTNLGLATGVIGGAEIVGELTAGWSVDRFGKRKVAMATGMVTALSYFLIPYTSVTLGAALVTLFVVFLSFEITIVGSIPLLTEVVPTARSVVLSMTLAAASLGRMLGALAGPLIWRRSGLPGTTLVSALLMLMSLFILFRWVREPDAGHVPAVGDG